MINEREKETLKEDLKNLILQTYAVEEEYKKINESYKKLQDTIHEIIESLPNAIWVINNENKNIFLQNSEAKKIEHLFEKIELNKSSYELEDNNRIYLIKINETKQKTIVTATDITEQKRSERLASMGQIAAHLSHEIRNPIGSVALLSSTLLKKVDIESKPLVLEIKKALWRIERIVKSTLLFTKGVSINPEKFYIDELIEELEAAKESYTFSKDIDFYYDLPSKEMRGDFDLLLIVFQNFLFNAIDAIEESETDKGEVSFKYKESENFHIFEITDNGKEIEDKNILYEPFKTTKTKGHGLGLALSLEIVKAHKGDIKLLKDKKGFEIYIKK